MINNCLFRKFKPLEKDKFNHLIIIIMSKSICTYSFHLLSQAPKIEGEILMVDYFP